MKSIKVIENLTHFFKHTPFLKDIKLIDLYFVGLLLVSLYLQLPNIKFIYESSITVLRLAAPLVMVFVWIWVRSNLDRSSLLSSASIIFAVFVFLVSLAYSNDSKIKLLSDMNGYNCMVAQNILTLKDKINLSSNFTLNYFVFQPYLDNASFIFHRLGTTTGAELLSSASSAQSANSLINQVQSLNIQGSSPLFGQFIIGPLQMYNGQLIEIASSTSKIFCKQLF